MSKIEKLWPVIFLPLGLTVLLLSLSVKAQAFDANIYARAGAGWQIYEKNGGLCETVTISYVGRNEQDQGVKVDKREVQGYIGYADAGFWVNPFAKIYLMTGYSFIGCTEGGQSFNGPMLALRAGKNAYIETLAMYVKDPDFPEKDGVVVYRAGIGAKAGALSLDAFAFARKLPNDEKALTGVLGLTFNF